MTVCRRTNASWQRQSPNSGQWPRRPLLSRRPHRRRLPNVQQPNRRKQRPTRLQPSRRPRRGRQHNERRDETADADRLNAPAKPSSRDKVVAQLNISGRWRDNWGTVFTITQDGNAIRVAAEGNSCRGGYFRSTASGTVTGNSFETTYQSTLPSRGECFGTVSASGTRMTSTCRDTVCGQFASSADRL